MIAGLGGVTREELTKSKALDFLKEKDRSAYTSIVRSEILNWDWKDYSKYDRQLEQNKKIKEALILRLRELIGPSTLIFRPFHFFYLPEPKLYYKREDHLNCLDWMSQIHIFIDAEIKQYPPYYFGVYFSPKDNILEPISLFRTPMNLLKYLTEGNRESSDVKIVATYSNKTGFHVTGLSDEIVLSDSFIAWINGLSSGKGVNDFLSKMLSLGLLDQRNYDIVIDKFKSESEPFIKYSELVDKDKDRLIKIDKIKDYHPYSWWGKNILDLTSRQGTKDYLEKMERGEYIRTHKEENGVRVELTEKGRRALE